MSKMSSHKCDLYAGFYGDPTFVKKTRIPLAACSNGMKKTDSSEWQSRWNAMFGLRSSLWTTVRLCVDATPIERTVASDPPARSRPGCHGRIFLLQQAAIWSQIWNVHEQYFPHLRFADAIPMKPLWQKRVDQGRRLENSRRITEPAEMGGKIIVRSPFPWRVFTTDNLHATLLPCMKVNNDSLNFVCEQNTQTFCCACPFWGQELCVFGEVASCCCYVLSDLECLLQSCKKDASLTDSEVGSNNPSCPVWHFPVVFHVDIKSLHSRIKLLLKSMVQNVAPCQQPPVTPEDAVVFVVRETPCVTELMSSCFAMTRIQWTHRWVVSGKIPNVPKGDTRIQIIYELQAFLCKAWVLSHTWRSIVGTCDAKVDGAEKDAGTLLWRNFKCPFQSGICIFEALHQNLSLCCDTSNSAQSKPGFVSLKRAEDQTRAGTKGRCGPSILLSLLDSSSQPAFASQCGQSSNRALALCVEIFRFVLPLECALR